MAQSPASLVPQDGWAVPWCEKTGSYKGNSVSLFGQGCLRMWGIVSLFRGYGLRRTRGHAVFLEQNVDDVSVRGGRREPSAVGHLQPVSPRPCSKGRCECVCAHMRVSVCMCVHTCRGFWVGRCSPGPAHASLLAQGLRRRPPAQPPIPSAPGPRSLSGALGDDARPVEALPAPQAPGRPDREGSAEEA